MNYIKILFHIIEIAFILQYIPDSFIVRFYILSIYFIAHYFKLQYEYSKLKYVKILIKYYRFLKTSNF